MNWFYPSVAVVALVGMIAIACGAPPDAIVGLCLGGGFFMMLGKLFELVAN